MSVELFLTKPVKRLHREPTVWVFGCSVAHGIGLTDMENQSFGKLVADQLHMPWQRMTEPGSSAHWALTHILHSEIQPSDIVVWAVTYPERYRWAINFDRVECRGLGRGSHPPALNWFRDPQIYFQHQDIINTGVRYLRAINSKFVFTTFINPSPYKDLIENNLRHYPEWCDVGPCDQSDKGTDNLHPGPIGHQELAKHIHDHVHLLKYV